MKTEETVTFDNKEDLRKTIIFFIFFPQFSFSPLALRKTSTKEFRGGQRLDIEEHSPNDPEK
ncbi:hypothetical protein E2C01_036712 [Portunus trituberculatus]|uniref:Uncharacterized protein n=1 Tax=Portunus trituberculatus TaxID=210409 RepID=A0A5B7FCP6_PORTR|nr:hypothetical protein [Portunus trituberculatus]